MAAAKNEQKEVNNGEQELTKEQQAQIEKQEAIIDDTAKEGEIESVTLTKDGKEFTIAKSIWDAEKDKPEALKDVKEGQPVYLKHPDLVGAKLA